MQGELTRQSGYLVVGVEGIGVLIGAGVEQPIFKVRRTDAGVVNTLTEQFEPGAHFPQRTLAGGREKTIRLRCDVQSQIAALAHHIQQQMHQLTAALEMIGVMEGELLPHGGAGFPGYGEGGVRHRLFRGDEVFIFTAAGALAHDHLGLGGGTYLLHDLPKADVLPQIVWPNPAAIQPEHVDLAVVGAKLPDLLMGELHILFPQLGVFVHIVVHVAGGGGAELGRPVVRAVPVGLGEVGGDGKPLAAEFPVKRAHHVRVRMGVEGAVRPGDLVVGGLGVVHAEAVVVFGGEQQIFETAFTGQLRPGGGIEFHRVEGFVGVPVLLLAHLGGCPGEVLLTPGGIAVAQRPALVGAQLAAGGPVHHEAQLQAHEPFQMLLHLGRFGRNIFLRRGVIMNAVGNDLFFHGMQFLSHGGAPANAVF